MLKIGIDPGTKTGVAVVRYGEIETLITTDFWGAFDFIIETFPSFITHEIHIEDTSDLPVFHGAPNKRAMGDVGKRVGGVIKEADLMIRGLEKRGYNVIRRTGKRSSKMDAETFNRVFNFTGRCSQHARDAAVLVV